MQPIFMTTKDVCEALEFSPPTARKMMNYTNEVLKKEGYLIPSSGHVPIRKFCDVHGIEYDVFLRNLVEVRSKRGKYARTNPM